MESRRKTAMAALLAVETRHLSTRLVRRCCCLLRHIVALSKSADDICWDFLEAVDQSHTVATPNDMYAVARLVFLIVDIGAPSANAAERIFAKIDAIVTTSVARRRCLDTVLSIIPLRRKAAPVVLDEDVEKRLLEKCLHTLGQTQSPPIFRELMVYSLANLARSLHVTDALLASSVFADDAENDVLLSPVLAALTIAQPDKLDGTNLTINMLVATMFVGTWDDRRTALNIFAHCSATAIDPVAAVETLAFIGESFFWGATPDSRALVIQCVALIERFVDTCGDEPCATHLRHSVAAIVHRAMLLLVKLPANTLAASLVGELVTIPLRTNTHTSVNCLSIESAESNKSAVMQATHEKQTLKIRESEGRSLFSLIQQKFTTADSTNGSWTETFAIWSSVFARILPEVFRIFPYRNALVRARIGTAVALVRHRAARAILAENFHCPGDYVASVITHLEAMNTGYQSEMTRMLLPGIITAVSMLPFDTDDCKLCTGLLMRALQINAQNILTIVNSIVEHAAPMITDAWIVGSVTKLWETFIDAQGAVPVLSVLGMDMYSASLAANYLDQERDAIEQGPISVVVRGSLGTSSDGNAPPLQQLSDSMTTLLSTANDVESGGANNIQAEAFECAQLSNTLLSEFLDMFPELLTSDCDDENTNEPNEENEEAECDDGFSSFIHVCKTLSPWIEPSTTQLLQQCLDSHPPTKGGDVAKFLYVCLFAQKSPSVSIDTWKMLFAKMLNEGQIRNTVAVLIGGFTISHTHFCLFTHLLATIAPLLRVETHQMFSTCPSEICGWMLQKLELVVRAHLSEFSESDAIVVAQLATVIAEQNALSDSIVGLDDAEQLLRLLKTHFVSVSCFTFMHLAVVLMKMDTSDVLCNAIELVSHANRVVDLLMREYTFSDAMLAMMETTAVWMGRTIGQLAAVQLYNLSVRSPDIIRVCDLATTLFGRVCQIVTIPSDTVIRTVLPELTVFSRAEGLSIKRRLWQSSWLNRFIGGGVASLVGDRIVLTNISTTLQVLYIKYSLVQIEPYHRLCSECLSLLPAAQMSNF